MAINYDAAVLVGSLRPRSYTGLPAEAVINLDKEPLTPPVLGEQL